MSQLGPIHDMKRAFLVKWPVHPLLFKSGVVDLCPETSHKWSGLAPQYPAHVCCTSTLCLCLYETVARSAGQGTGVITCPPGNLVCVTVAMKPSFM
jgi:hypothetical protein